MGCSLNEGTKTAHVSAHCSSDQSEKESPHALCRFGIGVLTATSDPKPYP